MWSFHEASTVLAHDVLNWKQTSKTFEDVEKEILTSLVRVAVHAMIVSLFCNPSLMLMKHVQEIFSFRRGLQERNASKLKWFHVSADIQLQNLNSVRDISLD